MKWLRTFAVLLFISFILPAQVIKIGSIAPDRSPWNDALKEIAREWETISQGQVKLKIYPGGIAGSEEDMIRKMKVGTLGGAVLTNIGLTKIYPDSFVLSTPFMFHSETEMAYVLKQLTPTFEKQIKEKGFQVIIWTMSGWVNFFSKYPVLYPQDLKKQKLAFATGEPEMEQAWKKSGYYIVPTELKDLMMALQSGMVEAFYLPPLIAGSGQYFPLAPHMCTLKIAPLVGGMVIVDRDLGKDPGKRQAAHDGSGRSRFRQAGQADGGPGSQGHGYHEKERPDHPRGARRQPREMEGGRRQGDGRIGGQDFQQGDLPKAAADPPGIQTKK